VNPWAFGLYLIFGVRPGDDVIHHGRTVPNWGEWRAPVETLSRTPSIQSSGGSYIGVVAPAPRSPSYV
jgi:hypothetical protein